MPVRRFLGPIAVFLVFAVAGLALAQQPTVQQSLASTLKALGACQSQLGPLVSHQADMVAGVYLDAAEIQKRIEAANPGMTFDPKTFKVAPAK